MEFFGPNTLVDGRGMRTEHSRREYEQGVMNHRATIKGVTLGGQLLELLCNNPQPIIIAPTRSLVNAEARALKGTDATSPSFSVTKTDGTAASGSGKGSMSVIDFNPRGTFRGIAPDVTLLHELVHAWRQARGRWNPVSMSNLVNQDMVKNPAEEARNFANWEEFLALVVESTYAAEKGQTSVRTAQGDVFFGFTVKTAPQTPNIFNPLPMTSSQNFAERYRKALIRILNEEQDLYKLLLKSPAWFNPVRDMAGMAKYKQTPPPPGLQPNAIFPVGSAGLIDSNL